MQNFENLSVPVSVLVIIPVPALVNVPAASDASQNVGTDFKSGNLKQRQMRSLLVLEIIPLCARGSRHTI